MSRVNVYQLSAIKKPLLQKIAPLPNHVHTISRLRLPDDHQQVGSNITGKRHQKSEGLGVGANQNLDLDLPGVSCNKRV